MPSKLFYVTRDKLASQNLAKLLKDAFVRRPPLQRGTYVGRNSVSVVGTEYPIREVDGDQLSVGASVTVENVGRPSAAIYVLSPASVLSVRSSTDNSCVSATVDDHDHLGGADSGGILYAYIAMTDNFAGGANVTHARLREWTQGEEYELLTIFYSATYPQCINSANIKWPDGSGGVFTTITFNSTWRVIDSYKVTHADSGKTVTQPAVTRNSQSDVTAKPELVIT